MIANETREFVTVEFANGMSAIAFGCLTTKALGLAPETRATPYTHGLNCTVAMLFYGPLAADESKALEEILRAYATHPGHRGSLRAWMRMERSA